MLGPEVCVTGRGEFKVCVGGWGEGLGGLGGEDAEEEGWWSEYVTLWNLGFLLCVSLVLFCCCCFVVGVRVGERRARVVTTVTASSDSTESAGDPKSDADIALDEFQSKLKGRTWRASDFGKEAASELSVTAQNFGKEAAMEQGFIFRGVEMVSESAPHPAVKAGAKAALGMMKGSKQ